MGIILSTDVNAARNARVTAVDGRIAVEVSGPERPTFAQYRVRNHVAMVPDRGFVKQLKKLGENLEVVWDAVSERWEIWEFPKDAPGRHITTVQTKNKTYRELGMDVLLQLSQMAQLSTMEILDYLEEHNNQMLRRKQRDFSNYIEAVSKETFNYVKGILSVQVSPKAPVPILKKAKAVSVKEAICGNS
jgi:hypothetical protein